MLQATFYYTVFLVIGSLLVSVAWLSRIPELEDGAFIGLLISSVCLIALLFLPGRRSAEILSAMIFIFLTAVAAVIIAYNHASYIRHNLPFQPYIGTKLLVLVIPLICPPKRWAAFLSIAILILVAVQNYFSWDPSVRTQLTVQEPWVTVLFGVLAAIAYHYRLRIWELHDMEVRGLVRMKSLEEFSHLLLGAQHLVNNTLQKVEILAHVMMNKSPEAGALGQEFSRCFENLREVSRALSLADTKIRWDKMKLPADVSELELQVQKLMEEFRPRHSEAKLLF
jgi:hypothetical protein